MSDVVAGGHFGAGAPRARRGPPRLRRGGPNDWGVWGASSGPVLLAHEEDRHGSAGAVRTIGGYGGPARGPPSLQHRSLPMPRGRLLVGVAHAQHRRVLESPPDDLQAQREPRRAEPAG